jgi:hypothetical protein
MNVTIVAEQDRNQAAVTRIDAKGTLIYRRAFAASAAAGCG